MAPRIPTILRNRLRCRCFHSTTKSSYNYHPKVYAYDFKVPQLAAFRAVHAAAVPCLAFLQVENDQYLSAIGIALRGFAFPLTGKSPDLSLDMMQAMYIPTWTLDAEVLGDITYTKPRRAGVSVRSAFMPGHSAPHAEALARVCLNSRAAKDDGFVPRQFRPSMLNQEDVEGDIFPIPYTLSPFALPALLRSIPVEDARLGDELTFTPSSIRFSMFSATPILHPVYLAKFTIVATGQTMIILLDAAHETDTPSVYTLQPTFDQIVDFADSKESEWIREVQPWCDGMTISVVSGKMGDTIQHAIVRAPDDSPSEAALQEIENKLPEAVKSWAEQANWEDLEGLTSVDDNMWSDSRIASWDSEAEEKRMSYLLFSRQARIAERMASRLSTQTSSPQTGGDDLPGTERAKHLEVLKEVMDMSRKERDTIRDELGLRGEDLAEKSITQA